MEIGVGKLGGGDGVYMPWHRLKQGIILMVIHTGFCTYSFKFLKSQETIQVRHFFISFICKIKKIDQNASSKCVKSVLTFLS